MSRPPGFFQQISPGAWIGFFTVYLRICVVWPELLGLGVGIGFFYVIFYATYKALGG